MIQVLSKGKKKVGISSSAGFTRGIIAYRITPRVLLFDTPGVMPLDNEDECDVAIKGAINPEKVRDKEAVVNMIISVYVGWDNLLASFGIEEAFIRMHTDKDVTEGVLTHIFGRRVPDGEVPRNDQLKREYFNILIHLIGLKRGLLGKGGKINEEQVYTTIIHYWQRNRIRYYALPPPT